MRNNIELLDCDSIASFKEKGKIFGLSIKINEKKEIIHVGLSFYEDEEVLICHFTESGISIDALNKSYFLVFMDLNEEDILAICGFFHAISEVNGNIPFSFSLGSSKFDNDSKQFLPQNSYSGLTCCSFVYLGLECCGYKVIEKDTWLSRDEDFFLEKAYMSIYNNNIISNHQEKLPFPRVRPEELALACGLYNYEPFTFEYISNNIEIIEDKIHSLLNN